MLGCAEIEMGMFSSSVLLSVCLCLCLVSLKGKTFCQLIMRHIKVYLFCLTVRLLGLSFLHKGAKKINIEFMKKTMFPNLQDTALMQKLQVSELVKKRKKIVLRNASLQV